MKKMLTILMCAVMALTAVAGPKHGGHDRHRGGHPHGHYNPPVHHVHPHHYHIRTRDYVAGGAIAGGIIVGSLIADAITPRRETVVVTTPAVSQTTVAAVPVATPIYSSAEVIGVNPAPVVYHQTQVQRVWVPGHYETRYLGNGVTTQVYVPGYWQ